MARIEPTAKILGATVHDVDLARAVNDRDFAEILHALGEHGVLRFPAQHLEPADLAAFSRRLGTLQGSVTGTYCEPGMPDVMILSNVIENGQPIGLADAGQDWHTDMSYNETIGFVNVLYALKVPHRDGKPLGSTHFANMHAAYEGLPDATRRRLEGRMIVHDFNKFWEEMCRRPGSSRPPLTPEQRAKRPPSRHPAFLVHPITGRRVLYANPGYAVAIEDMDPAESDALLQELFDHQLQPKYQYAHEWTVGDVLVWDHIGTLHNAIPDYRPDEIRLMKRCQVLADRIFDPNFVAEVLAPLAVAAE